MKPIPLKPRELKQGIERTKKKSTKPPGVKAGDFGKRTAHLPSIELYGKEECRFTHAVRQQLSDLGLDYVTHTVPDHLPLKHELLIRAGGKDQIPFLVDHKTGVKLYGSGAIRTYLAREYGIPPKNRLVKLIGGIDSRIQNRREQITWALRNPVDELRRLQKDTRQTLRSLKKSYQALHDALWKEPEAA